MAIILDTTKARLERHIRDPTKLGVLHTTKLVVHSQSVTVVFTYWPGPSTLPENTPLGASDALHFKLLDYLTCQAAPSPPHALPLEWLQATILHRRGSQTTDNHFFLCGDFNTGFRLTDPSPCSLARFMATLGLTTVLSQVLAAHDIHCHSFFRGEQATTIDDMGTTMSDHSVHLAGRGHAATWKGLCDHVPSVMGHKLGTTNHRQIFPVSPLVCPPKLHIDVTKPHIKKAVIQTLAAWWSDYWPIPEGYQPSPHSPESMPPLPLTLAETGAVTEKISRDLTGAVLVALGKQPHITRTNRLPDRYLMAPRTIAFRVHRQCLHNMLGILTPATALGHALHKCRRSIRQWQAHIRKQTTSNTYVYDPITDGRTDAEGWLHLFEHALTDSVTFDAERQQQTNLIFLLATEAAELDKLCHVRQRRKKKTSIQDRSAAREQDALQTRLKKVIASISEKPSSGYNYNELTLPDGSSLTDPKSIHVEITCFFANLFKHPPDALPTVLGLEDPLEHPESETLWMRMLHDPALFKETFSSTNVPADVVELIAEAFSDPARTQTAAEHIAKRFEEPITFTDFKRMLMRSRGNSAGGLTGLTYGVLKLAPEGLLIHIFQLLSHMWEHHFVPDHWKDKYLHLMVKDPSQSGLNNLRPIGLIEVLRKLWSNLIIHRVRCGLMDCNFLADNQYGFLPKRGTTDELIQLINVLEEAAELETPIDISTWDIRKAFDSVARALQLVLWLRMGVPLAIARWFINLDSGGHFIVRSPWAEDQIHHHFHPSSPSTSTTPTFAQLRQRIGFCSQRGFTQGDVLSTTGWVGFFDILLRALDKAPQPGPFYYRGEGLNLHHQKPMAYADDLVTISSNREQTQAYSRIICGFMAIFGLALAPDKIRTSTSARPPGDIHHYDWQWREHTRPFGDADHAVPILGIHVTASCNWTPLYHRLITHCTKIAQTAGSKMASLSTKARVLVASSVAQVLYRTVHAALTPDQQQHLTQILLQVLRDFRSIGPRFPTDALLTASLGGAFTDIGTFTILRKWSIQGRMEAIRGPQKSAMLGIQARSLRIRYTDSSPSGQSAIAPCPLVGALPRWADDLARSKSTQDCAKYFGSHTEPTIDDLFPAHSHGEILEHLNVHYIRELRSIEGPPGWLCSRNLPRYGDSLSGLLHSSILTSLPTSPDLCHALTRSTCTLARDQLYHFPGEGQSSTYFEIDGLLPNGTLAGRWWRSAGHRSPLLPADQTRRHGSAHSSTWDMINPPLSDSRRTLAFRYHYTDNPRILGTHPDLCGVLPPVPHRTPAAWCQPALSCLLPLGLALRGLVCDASFVAGRPSLHSLFASESTRPTWARGAIVVMGPPAEPPPLGIIIHGMEDLEHYNAFVGELISGLGQSQLLSQLPGRLRSYQDCNSVLMKTGNTLPTSSECYTNLQDDYGPILAQLRSLLKDTTHPPTQWTQGHPDATKLRKNGSIRPAIPRYRWGMKEFGIYIADLLASPSPAAAAKLQAEGLYPSNILNIPVDVILDALPSAGQWLRCSRASPNRPLLRPPRDTEDRHRLNAYLTTRDHISTRPPLWTSAQLGFLRPTLSALNATYLVSRWASFMRYILDRVPHARNKRKWTSDTIALDMHCQLCEDLDHTGQHQDDLEHLLSCAHPTLADERTAFYATLVETLHNLHTDKQDAYMTYSLTKRYIRTCCVPHRALSPQDRLSGWLARPTPAFLYTFSPNLTISPRVAREFTRALPILLKRTVTWIQSAWLLRCRILHCDDTTGDLLSSAGNPDPSPPPHIPPIYTTSTGTLSSYGFTGSHPIVRERHQTPSPVFPQCTPPTMFQFLRAVPTARSPHISGRPIPLTIPSAVRTSGTTPSPTLFTGPWAPDFSSPDTAPSPKATHASLVSPYTSGNNLVRNCWSRTDNSPTLTTQPGPSLSPPLPSPIRHRRSSRNHTRSLGTRANRLLHDLSTETHHSTLRFRDMHPPIDWT